MITILFASFYRSHFLEFDEEIYSLYEGQTSYIDLLKGTYSSFIMTQASLFSIFSSNTGLGIHPEIGISFLRKKIIISWSFLFE